MNEFKAAFLKYVINNNFTFIKILIIDFDKYIIFIIILLIIFFYFFIV